MVKLIRANQKTFLAGLTILSMITFLVSRGNNTGDHAVADHPFGTVNGKTIYTSEVAEAHNELSALKTELDFSSLDDPAQRQDARAQLIRGLIRLAGNSTNPEWVLLLRHEADNSTVQISNDDVETMLTAY